MFTKVVNVMNSVHHPVSQSRDQLIGERNDSVVWMIRGLADLADEDPALLAKQITVLVGMRGTLHHPAGVRVGGRRRDFVGQGGTRWTKPFAVEIVSLGMFLTVDLTALGALFHSICLRVRAKRACGLGETGDWGGGKVLDLHEALKDLDRVPHLSPQRVGH